MQNIEVNFEKLKIFEPINFSQLEGIIGLYFISLREISIRYPFHESHLIYIGMSEKKTNSIGKRLTNHYESNSGNYGLINYKKVEQLYFTHLNFQVLQGFWKFRVEDLESYFILDFVNNFGVYPICNNKTGVESYNFDQSIKLKINWDFFG